MKTQTKQNLVHRAKSIGGHMRSVERMLDEDAYCIDIIKQVQAVQSALAKLSEVVLANHMQSCVTNAIRGTKQSERARVIKEIVDVYRMGAR